MIRLQSTIYKYQPKEYTNVQPAICYKCFHPLVIDAFSDIHFCQQSINF